VLTQVTLGVTLSTLGVLSETTRPVGGQGRPVTGHRSSSRRSSPSCNRTKAVREDVPLAFPPTFGLASTGIWGCPLAFPLAFGLASTGILGCPPALPPTFSLASTGILGCPPTLPPAPVPRSQTEALALVVPGPRRGPVHSHWHLGVSTGTSTGIGPSIHQHVYRSKGDSPGITRPKLGCFGGSKGKWVGFGKTD
jgi:hypothetical protein